MPETQLEELAAPIIKSGYGKYLLSILHDPYLSGRTEKQ